MEKGNGMALQLVKGRKRFFAQKLQEVVNKGHDVAVVAGAVVVAAATKSHAALTFTGVTLNTADVESVMMLVIPALATLWGFRKIVKSMNRS